MSLQVKTTCVGLVLYDSERDEFYIGLAYPDIHMKTMYRMTGDTLVEVTDPELRRQADIAIEAMK